MTHEDTTTTTQKQFVSSQPFPLCRFAVGQVRRLSFTMNWFNGSVEVAVKKALDEKKLFIVYIEGMYEEV